MPSAIRTDGDIQTLDLEQQFMGCQPDSFQNGRFEELKAGDESGRAISVAQKSVIPDLLESGRKDMHKERFYRTIGKRLKKFGLELAAEKTKITSFSRFRKHEKTSVEFLGFEFRWVTTHNGKDNIARKTSRVKLRKSIKAFTQWCKENRNRRIKRIVEMLNAKLRGYFNYYGIIGNSKGINEFYSAAMKILYKWLNRRSQRRSFNWEEFNAKMKWYGLIKPRVTEVADNQVRFEGCFV